MLLSQQLFYVGWSEVVRNGWVVAVVALVAALAQSTFSQASTHLVAMEGIHVKAALQAMVYHKSLRLSATTQEEQEACPRRGSQDKGRWACLIARFSFALFILFKLFNGYVIDWSCLVLCILLDNLMCEWKRH